MVMSTSQKALIYANIPTQLYEYTVEKRLRDRFFTSPVTYPAMTVTFQSEGIKKHWNTHGPVEHVWNTTTHRWDDYYGAQDAAMISVTLWSEDETELRIMAESLYRQLHIRGLDLVWATDQVKVTNVKGVQWLEPFADEFVQEHTWRAVIDFEVEYLWTEIEIMPAIRSFQYLFTIGPDGDTAESNSLVSVQIGSYLMDINMRGWKCPYDADMLVMNGDTSAVCGMDMIVI